MVAHCSVGRSRVSGVVECNYAVDVVELGMMESNAVGPLIKMVVAFQLVASVGIHYCVKQMPSYYFDLPKQNSLEF